MVVIDSKVDDQAAKLLAALRIGLAGYSGLSSQAPFAQGISCRLNTVGHHDCAIAALPMTNIELSRSWEKSVVRVHWSLLK